MKNVGLFFMALVCTSMAFSQNKTDNSLTYKTGVGVKIFNGVGANVKTFISEKAAIDIVAFFSGEGTRFTAHYEFHGDLSTEGNLKWYLGPGVNLRLQDKNTIIGPGFIIGADYKFKELPFNIAIDWQPAIEFGGGYGTRFRSSWAGVALRYTL